MKIKYKIFSPCGNDTALVFGNEYNFQTKKKINDLIMEKHSNVEQIGFIDKNKYNLQMAGGEFCGNATRSAVYEYLNGEKGNIYINVSGSEGEIESGVDFEKNAWVQMPIYNNTECLKNLDIGIFEVKLKGITIVIIEENISKKYLEDKKKIKENAMEIIKKYNIEDSSAIGIVFLEIENTVLKINPVVWVKSIDTLFYETACGTASIALALKEAISCNISKKIEIMQPSNEIILAQVIIENNIPIKAIISGKVKTNNLIEEIELSN